MIETQRDHTHTLQYLQGYEIMLKKYVLHIRHFFDFFYRYLTISELWISKKGKTSSLSGRDG